METVNASQAVWLQATVYGDQCACVALNSYWMELLLIINLKSICGIGKCVLVTTADTFLTVSTVVTACKVGTVVTALAGHVGFGQAEQAW
jgi:hypothetical protein